MAIADPKEYPVIFTLDKRKVSPVEEGVSTVILEMETGEPLYSVACRYGDTYSIDHNPLSKDVGRATPGRRVIYEFVPSSQNTGSLSVNLKMWLSATDFREVSSGSIGRISQATSASHDIIHYVSASEAFNSLPPLSVSGVAYYPSLKVNYNARRMSDSVDGLLSGATTVGNDSPVTIFSGNKAGVCMFTFRYYYEWYLDESRTIKAAIVPGSLPSVDGNAMVTVVATKGGRVIDGGRVSSVGTAVFDGIPSGPDAGAVTALYAGEHEDGQLFSYSESISFNADGTPNQEGNVGASYLLSQGSPTSSSSSSCSSSSSLSSSCSSSSISSSSWSSSSSSCSSSSRMPALEFCVSGAGSPQWNGKYYEAGFYNGKPYYEIESGGLFMYWGAPNWALSGSVPAQGGPPDYATSTVGDHDPDVNTWYVIGGGSPAPKVLRGDCVSCAGGTEPSIILSVTGTATEIVYWCGKSWSLPAESGIRKEVCPTSWTYSWYTSYYAYSASGSQRWKFTNAGFGSLSLRRYATQTYFGGYKKLNQIYHVRRTNSDFSLVAIDKNFAQYPGSGSQIFVMGVLSAYSPPLPAPFGYYHLVDEFFGSFNSSGKIFTWERGKDWPIGGG